MQRYFSSLLFLFISTFALAQDTFNVNAYKYTINFDDHYVSFYTYTGDKRIRTTEPSKIYTWYTNNQLKTTQGGFSGKLLNGVYTDHYLNGDLKEQGTFKMGLKAGKWNKWNEKGKLLESITYQFGVLEGDFKKYNSNGDVMISGRYKNGKPDGVYKTYITADSVLVERYKKGTLQIDTAKNSKKKH